MLRIAAALERGSEHRLAAAIVAGAEASGVETSSASDFGSVTGKGVTGRVDRRRAALGNRRLMDDAGVALADLAERAEALRHEGQRVMFLAVDGRAVGLVGDADPIKTSTPEALDLLRASGLQIAC